MRITITLQESDGVLFRGVKEAAGMEFVEDAVYARHLFLSGLRTVARSADAAAAVARNVEPLKPATKRRKGAKCRK